MCAQKLIRYLMIVGLVSLSLVATDDVIISSRSQESKAKQVLTSKKFWGAIAGIGLLASGALGAWAWYSHTMQKNVNALRDDLIQFMDNLGHKDVIINRYTFTICDKQDNKMVVNKTISKHIGFKHTISLHHKTSPYVISLEVDLPSFYESNFIELLKQHYQEDFDLKKPL